MCTNHTQLPLTQGEEEEKGYEQLVNLSQKKTGRVSKDEFSMLKVIGTGSYGKVLLVKKKDCGKLYAMKVLKKKFIKESKQVKGTWAERKILERITHPFIVKLRYAFQTPKKLFLVLDYCPGGELFFYIQQIGRFKEESVKFYAANILLALECLHENGIVYRE
jgi:protein-serine/threonine kinase